MITKSTKRAICNRGNIARKMEFKTICKPSKETVIQCMNSLAIYRIILPSDTEIYDEQNFTNKHKDMTDIDLYLLGTPLTSFNGRITRNARNDLTSKFWILY